MLQQPSAPLLLAACQCKDMHATAAADASGLEFERYVLVVQAGAAKDKAAGAAGGNNPVGNFIDQAKAGADKVCCSSSVQCLSGVVQSSAGS